MQDKPQEVSAELDTFAQTYTGSSGQIYTAVDGKLGQKAKKTKTDGLAVPAFYSGVRFIAETLAGLPKHVYQKSGPSRAKVEHYLAPIMAEFPNDLVNAFYLWETALGHAVMYGNGYIWIERKGRNVVALHNLHACIVFPFRANGQQFYAVTVEKEKDPLILPSIDVIHVRNFSEDGEGGISVIDKLAQTVGMSAKFDNYLANYFERGALVNLVVEAQQKLTKEDVDNLRYGIETNHVGVDNAFKTMILSAATAKNLSLPLKEFALDTLKQASIIDVAQVLRIPPHTLYALNESNYNSLEWLGTELVKFSFGSWVLKIELECKRKLLTDRERADGFYIKWNLDGLQRGDYKSRVDAGVQLVNNRLQTPNEWRAQEDLEPYEGGDAFYGPLNTPQVGSEPTPEDVDTANNDPTEAPIAPTPTPEPSKALGETYGRFLSDASRRVRAKQDIAFGRQKNKPEVHVAAWLSRFSSEQGIYLAEALNPFLETVIQDKQKLAFCLQDVTEDYTTLVAQEREKAEPNKIIEKLLAKLEGETSEKNRIQSGS